MGESAQNFMCALIIMGLSIVVLSESEEACNRVNLHASDRNNLDYCKMCVSTVYNDTDKGKPTCYFVRKSNGYECTTDGVSELIVNRCISTKECDTAYGDNTTTTSTTTEPPPTTTNGTSTTTPAPTTTNGTSTTTTTPPPSTTNATTTTAPTTTTNGTTTVAPPTNMTTTAAPTTKGSSTTVSPSTTAKPAPHEDGGFRWGSFFGGIAFTAAMASVGYIVWRFYKARTERNYHTLTSNLI